MFITDFEGNSHNVVEVPLKEYEDKGSIVTVYEIVGTEDVLVKYVPLNVGGHREISIMPRKYA